VLVTDLLYELLRVVGGELSLADLKEPTMETYCRFTTDHQVKV
jgi:hypothetical protein